MELLRADFLQLTPLYPHALFQSFNAEGLTRQERVARVDSALRTAGQVSERVRQVMAEGLARMRSDVAMLRAHGDAGLIKLGYSGDRGAVLESGWDGERQAQDVTLTGERLRRFPLTMQAWREGRLVFSKVRLLCRHVHPGRRGVGGAGGGDERAGAGRGAAGDASAGGRG